MLTRRAGSNPAFGTIIKIKGLRATITFKPFFIVGLLVGEIPIIFNRNASHISKNYLNAPGISLSHFPLQSFLDIYADLE